MWEIGGVHKLWVDVVGCRSGHPHRARIGTDDHRGGVSVLCRARRFGTAAEDFQCEASTAQSSGLRGLGFSGVNYGPNPKF